MIDLRNHESEAAMTAMIRVDLRPNGYETARISPWEVQRALLEALEPGAGSHCISTVFPDGSTPASGVYVAHHLRLDVCIVVDDRPTEERWA